MKRLHWMAVLLLVGALSAGASGAPNRIGDFGLLDSDGNFHQLSRYRNKEALVIMSFADSCNSIDSFLTQFKAKQSEWEARNVDFLLINSSVELDLENARSAIARRQIDIPLLLDDAQVVSETLNLSKAGEVVVLDPESLALIYRGPLQSQLDESLSAEVAGTADSTLIVEAAGCALAYPVKDLHAETTPDYATEVAPIITKQCATCHREGGIGPFAMNSHLVLQGWSPIIREVLLTKRMPPAQVDPNISHFSNARNLSNEDLQTLVHWIDAGSPRGTNSRDPLTELEAPHWKTWTLGQPDYIVKAPKMEVPATGVLDYINIAVDLPFEEDKWVRAVQFIPGDESVLHHLLTYVTAPAEEFDGDKTNTGSIATRFLEGYAPGKVDAMVFPNGTGVFIPKGHNLSMQFHFTSNGLVATDETLLGLYMYEEPPKYESFTQPVSSRFRIPAYAQDHKASATYVFEENIVVTGLRPHMHFRGKNMKFTAEAQDGTLTDLLSVPNYSYAWQPTYILDKPMALPAGTRVHVSGAFDNSEFNPANPNPSHEVTFGLQSSDEMFIGYLTYHTAKPSN